MKLWLPGAEKIPGAHAKGLPMLGGNCLVTHHITVTGKGSYAGTKSVLLREGFEPTLLLDPTTGQRGQFLPANRGAYALEHNGPPTNTEGAVHVQIEWVWPLMEDDITKAPHFAEIWADLIPWLDQLGVPRTWPFGFKSKSRSAVAWKAAGHRGHINAPGNSHVDNLPAVKRPAWPRAAKPVVKPPVVKPPTPPVVKPSPAPSFPEKGITVSNYNKAIIAVIGAVGTWALAALPDGTVTPAEWTGLGTALLTALGVYQVTNKRKPR